MLSYLTAFTFKAIDSYSDLTSVKQETFFLHYFANFMIAFTLTYFIYEVAIMREYLDSGFLQDYRKRKRRLKCERIILIILFSTSFTSKSLEVFLANQNEKYGPNYINMVVAASRIIIVCIGAY